MPKSAPAKNHRAPAKPSKPTAAPNGGGKPAAKNGTSPAKPAPKQEKPDPKAAKSAAKPPAPEVKGKSKAQQDQEAKILHLISEEMAIEEAELTPQASFREDLGLDAIDIAELLMQAEHAFNLNPFHEGDWESCETVEDFMKLIQKRLDAKRAKKG